MIHSADISNQTSSIKEWSRSLSQKTKGDKVIWALVVLLVLASLLVVYSATGSLAYKNYKGNTEIYLFKQVAFIILGIGIIYFAHRVNYIIYSKIAQLLFLLSIPLLIYTLFFGLSMNEGSRWIRLPIIGLNMQTSELATLALFMYLARLIGKKQDVIKGFRKGYLPLIAPVGIICLLIAPANLSTALLLGASCMLLLFIGRASTKHLLLTVGAVCIPILFLVIAAMISHRSTDDATGIKKESSSKLTARVDTWISRVQHFIYGGKDADDEDSYQINQAKIAIAKGGVMGVGPGNSTQRNFLPQAYNDFIYPIIVEEYGLIGGTFILF